jgi:molybdopterin-guanine dinucleotide biosynthesis protein A
MVIPNSFHVPGLIGLVVCGGKSARMGYDKSLLNYHGKPQRYHLYKMLEPFCEQVYISCNEDQLKDIKEGYGVMADLPVYHNNGPMSALLTAFSTFPKSNFLLIGCDYPFLTAEEISRFLEQCQAGNTIVFYNEKDDMYEPLLAFYHQSIKNSLMEMARNSQHSLQELLRKNSAGKYYPVNKKCIIGVNTREDFIKAEKFIDL